VIPHRNSVLLEGVDVFARHVVVSGRENGLDRVWLLDPETRQTRPVPFEEAVYEVRPDDNWEFATATLRLKYSSLVTPPSVYDLDMETGERTLRKRQEIPSGHDPDRYVSERLFVTAPDGARVPISLVALRRNADASSEPRPLLLYGYGSYGYSLPPRFDANRLSLLDRGVVFAIAHVRGGQELGRRWYEDGKLLKKKNTFTDFVACAEHLVATGRTAPDRLVARGASAGGLLMGAVANIRPDLFAAIVAEVPFVDVLRTMLDPSLPLTTGEYDEWGDPRDPVFRDYIASYSPYDNVAARDCPRLLITAGLHDDQVRYWEGAKWAAKLRALKTDDGLLLLKTHMGAGHRGSSGRYDVLRETALTYAFVLLDLPGTVDPPGIARRGATAQ
jgi:oligopeptidase B